MLGKMSSTKKLDYMDLIVNYFKKRRGRGGGFKRALMVIHI